MVREGGKLAMVAGVVPANTGFSGGTLPVIAILLPEELIPVWAFYAYVLGKEEGRAVDEVERALEISRADVRLIAIHGLFGERMLPLGLFPLTDAGSPVISLVWKA
jgi:hypothetical protein